MILFEHTPSLLLIALALLAVTVAGGFSMLRHLARARSDVLLGLTYGATFVLIAWCVLLPGRKEDLTHLLKPKFAVVLDTSASMALRPKEGATNRWEAAQHALTLPWASAMAAECDMEVYPLADGVGDPVPPADAHALVPDGEATRLRDGLKEIGGRFSGLNVAGVLVLSDGLDTREAYRDWAAEDRPFPVYSVRVEPPGQWVEEVEVRVEAVSTPRRVSVDWQSECKVLLSGQGIEGDAVVVQLYKDGALLDERPTRIPAGGGESEVIFDLEHPAIGVFNYRIHVPPSAGEANTNDNEFAVSVQVTDARNRLLYVEGIPRWEYKFMRRALLAQQDTTPVIFYSGPDGAPRRGSEHRGITAEMTPAQLAYFKLVILGNLTANELGSERVENLIDFVNDGGSLVVLGGSRAWGEDGITSMALGDILPIRGHTEAALVGDDPFPVSLTDAARAHPAFAGDAELWSMVPPVLSVFPGPTLSPTAQALVTADTPRGRLPIVVTHRYGQGKVAVLLTDSLWKWQLSPDANVNQPYQRFWTQMISWLLPEEDEPEDNAIQMFADREQLYLGEQVELTARIAGEEEIGATPVRAGLVFPDQRRVDFDMTGQWVSTLSGSSFPGYLLSYAAREPGLYTVVAHAGPTGSSRQSDPISFYVKPYSPETLPRPIDENVLRNLAESSGGQYFETLADLELGLSTIRPQAVEEATAEFRTLWRTWPVMLAIMALLITSWVNRKMRGMP